MVYNVKMKDYAVQPTVVSCEAGCSVYLSDMYINV